jgi:hypothetical protein
MRPQPFADTLRRELPWKGIAVRYVVNINDAGHACTGQGHCWNGLDWLRQLADR